ncbi:SH3 domain-containing protein [Streptomyces sp. NPDC052077]|uniref:SH3 domain-containing protein n=1 Tax=Streptomyces sp. NPDC052077 TaxID=3154757 RepID=UPI00341F384A
MKTGHGEERDGTGEEAAAEGAPVTEGRAGTGAVAGVAAAAAAASYPIAPGVQLNVRSGPGTWYSIVRVLPAGSRVTITCQRPGTNVAGPYGTTTLWDNIANGQYVSDAYVYTGSNGYVAPRCS